MTEKAAALIYGPQSHYLDHLAPLCYLLEIPLLVTEETIAALAKKYYPRLQVEYFNYLDAPEKIVQNFDILFYSMPRALFDEIFFFAETVNRKKVHTIWVPHGNSDKGNYSVFMEALEQEKVALVYGKKMIDYLIRKKVFNQLKAYVITGNLRYTFYRKELSFFRGVLPQFKKAVRTILYAPTWQDYEKSSSFFDATPHLLKNLPKEFNLIVKLHPNMLLENELEVQKLLWKYEGKDNVLFLADFPPIYPLLDKVDIYIGDTSSIGYDFLTFNKPMFFLNQNRREFDLFKCGKEIFPEDYANIYPIMEKNLKISFSEIQKQLYFETFGKERNWAELKEEILKTYEIFLDL